MFQPPLKWIYFSSPDIWAASTTRLCFPPNYVVIFSMMGALWLRLSPIIIEVYPILRPFDFWLDINDFISIIWFLGYSASPSEIKTKILFLSRCFFIKLIADWKAGLKHVPPPPNVTKFLSNFYGGIESFPTIVTFELNLNRVIIWFLSLFMLETFWMVYLRECSALSHLFPLIDPDSSIANI